ncbi:MAG: hypothetical protein EBY95_07865, partial [Actinobacteria bacterium]|nr:hypothetical protein [Actinomycetota bacterium]
VFTQTSTWHFLLLLAGLLSNVLGISVLTVFKDTTQVLQHHGQGRGLIYSHIWTTHLVTAAQR